MRGDNISRNERDGGMTGDDAAAAASPIVGVRMNGFNGRSEAEKASAITSALYWGKSSREADDGSEFSITVKSITGKLISIENVQSSNTLAEVKQMICDKEGVLPETQRLIAFGRGCEDDRTVEDYNICHGSVIYLVFKLR